MIHQKRLTIQVMKNYFLALHNFPVGGTPTGAAHRGRVSPPPTINNPSKAFNHKIYEKLLFGFPQLLL